MTYSFRPLRLLSYVALAAVMLFAEKPGQGQVLYTTGFESPGFISGSLLGQNGWLNDGATNAASVQTSIVRTGTQAVRINAALNPDGLSFYYRSLNFNTGGNKVIEVKWDMYLQSGSIESIFFGVDCFDSDVNYIGGLAVDAFTRFINLSDGDTHFDSDTLVQRNVWNSFRLLFDYSTRTITAYVNGVQIATGLRFATLANNVFGDADPFNDNRISPAGNDQGIFDNFSVTAQEVATTVSGIITPRDCVVRAGIPVVFEFRPLDNTPVFSRTVTLAADGAYTLTNLPRNNYTLHAKANKWLAQNVTLDTLGGNVIGLNFAPTGSDANNDNSVDVLDLALLIQTFDKCQGDPGYNSNADFNSDGCADVLDLDVLIRNFDAQGDS